MGFRVKPKVAQTTIFDFIEGGELEIPKEETQSGKCFMPRIRVNPERAVASAHKSPIKITPPFKKEKQPRAVGRKYVGGKRAPSPVGKARNHGYDALWNLALVRLAKLCKKFGIDVENEEGNGFDQSEVFRVCNGIIRGVESDRPKPSEYDLDFAWAYLNDTQGRRDLAKVRAEQDEERRREQIAALELNRKH